MIPRFTPPGLTTSAGAIERSAICSPASAACAATTNVLSEQNSVLYSAGALLL